MIPETKAIEQAAAAWVARRERGLSDAEESALATWRAADPRHAHAIRAMERSWRRLDLLRGTPVARRLEAELDELTRGAAAGSPSFWRRSAALCSHPAFAGALAASLVWLIAYAAWWRPSPASASYAATAATAVGVMRHLDLPDGSTVRLNTDTTIEVLFTKTERRVSLGRGEAFFRIAPNPARPFIVRAAGIEVRAVGTEFNVRWQDSAIEVTVRSGRVRVEDALHGGSLLAAPLESEAGAAVLGAGQRVVIPVMAVLRPAVPPAAPVALAAGEIARSLAWQERRLVFESAPLSEIVAEFNRYNQHRLEIADPELAARRFGGTFEATDPATLVELLRTSYEVVAEDGPTKTVLRLPR